jgi:hypothetical protein
MRVALIHALRHSIGPIEDAFQRHWPQARRTNLLDDSLSTDLAVAGGLSPAITTRIIALARYAAEAGARGVLFTCSAFGPAIGAAAAALAPLPVLRPNEAMIEAARAAAGAGGRIGLLASFAPTLVAMPGEFGAAVEIVPALAEGALAALERGDGPAHDRLAAAAAARAFAGCEVIALAQFSLARAAPAVAALTGRPVLTTPDSAVVKLRRLLEG